MPRPSFEASAADHAAARSLLRRGSKSFAAASLLLPKRVRGPAAALYGFCRMADDAIVQPGERVLPSGGAHAPALAETQFLVDAVAVQAEKKGPPLDVQRRPPEQISTSR